MGLFGREAQVLDGVATDEAPAEDAVLALERGEREVRRQIEGAAADCRAARDQALADHPLLGLEQRPVAHVGLVEAPVEALLPGDVLQRLGIVEAEPLRDAGGAETRRLRLLADPAGVAAGLVGEEAVELPQGVVRELRHARPRLVLLDALADQGGRGVDAEELEVRALRIDGALGQWSPVGEGDERGAVVVAEARPAGLAVAEDVRGPVVREIDDRVAVLQGLAVLHDLQVLPLLEDVDGLLRIRQLLGDGRGMRWGHGDGRPRQARRGARLRRSEPRRALRVTSGENEEGEREDCDESHGDDDVCLLLEGYGPSPRSSRKVQSDRNRPPARPDRFPNPFGSRRRAAERHGLVQRKISVGLSVAQVPIDPSTSYPAVVSRRCHVARGNRPSTWRSWTTRTSVPSRKRNAYSTAYVWSVGSGVPAPLERAHRARPLLAAHRIVLLLERLLDEVRREDGRPARSRVRERRLDDGGEVLLGRHVHHRVVHEHDVERPAEAQGPHVPEDVLALRVELAAEREHLLREVGEGAAEAPLQVRRVVPRTGAELEQRLGVRHGALEARADAGRLFDVLLGRREEPIPGHELAVHQHRGRVAKSPR